MTYASLLAKVSSQPPNKRGTRPAAQQITLHPGGWIALRQLLCRRKLLCSVLLTYHDHKRGIELISWHYDESPHTLYHLGTWHLIEDDADHHYLLRHE